MFSVCFSLGSPGANKKPKIKVEILKRFSLKYYLEFRLESDSWWRNIITHNTKEVQLIYPKLDTLNYYPIPKYLYRLIISPKLFINKFFKFI